MSETDVVNKIFFSWIVGFSVIETFLSLLPVSRNSLSFLQLMTDFAYTSIPFLKTLYIYKHVFKKSEYFPSKSEDLPIFVSIFVIIQVVLDSMFLYASQKISFNFPIKQILQRYDSVTSLAHSARVTTYGIIWIMITFFVYTKFKTLDGISTIVGALFILLLREYPDRP